MARLFFHCLLAEPGVTPRHRASVGGVPGWGLWCWADTHPPWVSFVSADISLPPPWLRLSPWFPSLASPGREYIFQAVARGMDGGGGGGIRPAFCRTRGGAGGRPGLSAGPRAVSPRSWQAPLPRWALTRSNNSRRGVVRRGQFHQRLWPPAGLDRAACTSIPRTPARAPHPALMDLYGSTSPSPLRGTLGLSLLAWWGITTSPARLINLERLDLPSWQMSISGDFGESRYPCPFIWRPRGAGSGVMGPLSDRRTAHGPRGRPVVCRVSSGVPSRPPTLAGIPQAPVPNQLAGQTRPTQPRSTSLTPWDRVELPRGAVLYCSQKPKGSSYSLEK